MVEGKPSTCFRLVCTLRLTHKPITEGRTQVFALMQFHRGSEPAREKAHDLREQARSHKGTAPTGLAAR